MMADLRIEIVCCKCKRVMIDTHTTGLYDRLERINPDIPCADCRLKDAQKAERILHARSVAKNMKGWWG